MTRKKQTKEPTERQLRVAEEIRHVLSLSLMKEDLYDEHIHSQMIMITAVKISPDFSWATIYVHSIGKEDNQEMVDALNMHKGHFRKLIGDAVRLRITPDVRFCLDNTFEEMAKIQDLLNNPVVQEDIHKKD